MSEKALKKYLRRVSRRLLALPGTRAALIAALEAELRERCPGGSYEELCSEFGPPERAAAELQQSVDESERAAVRSRQKKRAALLIGTCAALALLLALYIWYVQSSEIVIANETIMTIDQYQSYVERVKP